MLLVEKNTPSLKGPTSKASVSNVDLRLSHDRCWDLSEDFKQAASDVGCDAGATPPT